MSRAMILLVAALALGIAEAFVPGAFLLWIALAVGIVGAIDLVFEPSLLVEIGIFAVAAAASVAIGKRVYGSLDRAGAPVPLSRAHALVGREFTLASAIEDGFGSMRVDDSVWRVAGPPLGAGAKVKVVAVAEGALLRVVAA